MIQSGPTTVASNSAPQPRHLFRTPEKPRSGLNEMVGSTRDRTKRLGFKKFRKSVWSRDEDELLRQKVAEKGPTQWAEIAAFLPNRSGKQCRERWHNHLREGVTKRAWEPYQYWILALCVRAFGRKWSTISDFIPGRSDNTIKNQWNCKMKPYKEEFELNIERLIRHPECWSELTSSEKILLQIISKNCRREQSKAVNVEFYGLFDKYCQMLEAGLKEFFWFKQNCDLVLFAGAILPQHEEFNVYGDLSEAISAGEGLFCDSEEENPIMPCKGGAKPLDI